MEIRKDEKETKKKKKETIKKQRNITSAQSLHLCTKTEINRKSIGNMITAFL